jgi:hypothetical protein
MFGDATILAPIAKPSMEIAQTQPTMDASKAYAESVGLYLQAQKKLANDDSNDVVNLLKELTRTVQSIDADAARKMEVKLPPANENDIARIRESFKTTSSEIIALGHRVGLPEDASTLKVFRCPMANADWIQKPGETSNPYYGSEMLTCGAAVEDLPRVSQTPLTTRAPAEPILSVPRSSVIETGKRRLVYVQTNEGVFDLRQVILGPGDDQYYSVDSGLKEGDRVVTTGAFLIDSENRLNPASEAK